jgi:hypothetical protein
MKTSGTAFLFSLVMGAMISLQADTSMADSTIAVDSTCQKRKPTRSYHFFQTGIIQVDPEKLNDKITTVGCTGFDSYTFTGALGGHKEHKRFISEDQFTGSWWRRNDDNVLTSSLAAFNFSKTLGFNILPYDFNLNLFPYAGLGIGMNRLQIHQESVSLSYALSSVVPDRVFRQGQVTFNGGAGSDFIIPSRDGRCGFTIGVRGGYQIPLYTSKWHSKRTIISDLPDLKQQGFYVRLAVGGWGEHGKKSSNNNKNSHQCCADR